MVKVHKEGCDAVKCKCKPQKVDWNLADAMMKKKGVTLREYLETRDISRASAEATKITEETNNIFSKIK